MLRLVGAFVLAVALAVGWGAGRSLAAEDVSSALRAALLSGGPAAADAPQVDTAVLQPLYAARGYAPFWVEPAGAGPRAEALRAALQAARADGQAHTVALLDAIEARRAGGSARRLAELDLLLTQALARLGTAPKAGDEAAAAAVRTVAQAEDPATVLREILPPSPDFWRLRGAKERYRAIAAAGGWPMVPGTAKLSLGAVGPEVALLRQR
ncbi:MAG: hypothetical protein IRY94_14285, partial [Rhodospirillaceae bacterium]|nr:hypothetical protein [Rhodospirillaceae bacterium]